MSKCYAHGCSREGTKVFQDELFCAEHYAKITGAFDKFMELKCYFTNVKPMEAIEK